ncbi:MAG: sugar ABC transporter ATP-binding protein [Actinomycetota bacterium]
MSNGSSPKFALEMENIKKNFGPVVALSDADLRIAEGTIHGLIGQNGAGKSTLMKILSGYYPDGTYEGQIKVDGNVVKLKSPRDAQACGIAIVPQEITVSDTLTVAENILLSEFAKKPRKFYFKLQANKDIDFFLKENGIPLQADQLVANLTLPQKQILMIANALYMQPKVLVLDEPTSSLTNDEIETLFQIVRNLKRLGYTTVFITHKIIEITELCDYVTILRDGKIVYSVDRDNFDGSKLINEMIGRKLGDLYPVRSEINTHAEIVLSVRDLIVENPRKPGEKMLDAISFDLRGGEILGIGGLVGSGRSEILKALYRENLVLSGDVRVGDNKEYGKTIPEAISSGLYYITEDRKIEGLLFNMNVRGNITASVLKGLSKNGFLAKKAEKLMAKEITESLSVKPNNIEAMIGNLSGGNQQKVLIGKSLLARPLIFMLDEPTKGVDIASKAEIYRLIHDLAAQGAGVILVSSEFPEMLALCHRILVIANGKYQGEMPGDLSKEHELMVMASGGN